jgi:pimeloyl-ACP methyl ester carboxylesterase
MSESTASNSIPEEASELKPPSALMMMLEGRALWEYAALLVSTPLLSRLPAGDGHPVLVFPGFGAPDFSTIPLRKFLLDRGYAPHRWRLGFNFGPRDGVLQGCIDRTRALYKRYQQPVSLLGWSLGGVYAREVAKELPKETRCVITLGSPFSGHPRATNAWRFYEFFSGQPSHDPVLMAQVRQAPPVPTTSIYSRTDGIVAWQCSINDNGADAENIEVHASHVGMGMNPLALYVVADRLAQDPTCWRPFDVSGARRWFYRAGHAAFATPA